MKAASPAVEPEDLADIDGFCDALWLEDGLARATLASYRSDLAHLAVWLRARGRLFADPTLKLAHPVRPARLPKVLSEKQVEALLAAPDPGTPLGLRDRAMLEVLYASGLRVSELTGMALAQVGFNEGVARLPHRTFQTGNASRRIPADSRLYIRSRSE